MVESPSPTNACQFSNLPNFSSVPEGGSDPRVSSMPKGVPDAPPRPEGQWKPYKRMSKEEQLDEILMALVEKHGLPMYIRNRPFYKNLRPDILWDLVHSVLILECDEFQHKSYSKYAEAAREIELMNGCGGRPLVMVRYNPDDLKTLNMSSKSAGVVFAGTREESVAKIVVQIIHRLQKTPPVDQFTKYKLFYNCECLDEDHCGFIHKESWKGQDDYYDAHFEQLRKNKRGACMRCSIESQGGVAVDGHVAGVGQKRLLDDVEGDLKGNMDESIRFLTYLGQQTDEFSKELRRDMIFSMGRGVVKRMGFDFTKGA